MVAVVLLKMGGHSASALEASIDEQLFILLLTIREPRELGWRARRGPSMPGGLRLKPQSQSGALTVRQKLCKFWQPIWLPRQPSVPRGLRSSCNQCR
jgi:hypothetical protein